ncbi:MAG: protein kinase, partial [Kiritimatiellae bacterium]|nr:protein kinase [Kiritimatiellia bacterium]
VKLIDFEIARQDGASRTTTESGAMRGTVDYMAPDFHQDFRPEKGFRGDQCSDVFSLTVCLYEMLAGCRPYSAGGTLGEQSMMAYFQRWTRVPGVDVNRALKIEPYKIHALAHVQKVIKRGLSPERAGRYLTYFEFSDALRAVKLREIISPTGRYQLLRCVGKGGFGVVFRARRVDDGMIVAIKCLLRPEYSERFIREAKVLRKFHDDRLVSFVEYFKTVRGATETFFIVMQFLEGMPGFSLRDRINGVKAGGRIPPREIAEAFRRFAEGLQLLHEAGVIHRDIKPANLYMPPGHPEKSCVMDLGVAKTDETQTNGSLPGTLDYMPPEMATGTSRGDPAVDIYALGLCLYEALTCKTAYPRLKRGGDGLAEFYKRAKSGEKPDLSGLDGSPMWRKLVTKMTDPDVGRRVKTAKEVVRLIARIPDSELPDVREKDANAADRESTDNYVIPGSRGGALPAGETGESADSDSTEVHVDNATQEHESAESADGGTAVEEPAPPPSPARTNAEAEEKLSAAIAEVENIVAAQQVPQGDARDGTAADVGGQTLVLDATVAAQETTTAAQETTSAAATATAATKGFGGTAADLGGQTLVLDATAAAQETTTASVSATAATKALDGTAASIADRTIATAATSPEPPVRPSRIPLVSRDMGGPGAVPAAEPREPRSGAVATAESKAEPSVIISRPKRSRAPLVIAASLAICAVAGSLISVQKKADAEGKTIPQYSAEHHPGMWNLLPDFTARRVQKAEKTFGSDVARIVGRLNELRDEIGTSDKPDSYGDYLASAGEGIADAWARAEAKGVTNSATYAAVLANHGYAAITNGFLTAIINRRDELTREKEKAAAIKATEAGFREEAEKIMAPLRRLAEEIAKSKDPESFTNEIARADAELDAAWSKAKTAGVADSVLADCGFKTIANGLVDAIANRRKTLEDIAAAEARFREAADKIIAPLRGLEEEIVKSKDPESFTNEIVRTKTALDAAWSKAEKAGVADGVLADCGFKAIADGLVAAIDNRRNELARKENDAAAIAAAEASFRKEAETAIALLSGREQEIAGSKAPESFMGVMDKSTAALDAAWSKAKRAGVAYDVRDIVLSDCGYAEITNGFVAAIANRRAKLAIMDAVNEFADSSTNALASLQTLAEPNGEITTSDNPESFTNEIAAAWNALEAAWRKAEVAGVTNHAVYEAKLYSYATLSNQVATAIEKRRNELNAAVLANARGIFEKKADEALKLLRVLQGPTGAIVGSDNPDEYRVKIGEAREKLDTAWKTAMEAGVEDDVRKTKYTEFSICSNSVMTAISTRKEVLDGEYGQYVIKFDEHKKDAGKIRNAASHHEALTAIAKATKNLPSYGSSSPWKGKYDDLRKKYDALKASISAQTAKISVKNDGDVALAVTLGDKTATIEKGESHTFDKLAVWTDYK